MLKKLIEDNRGGATLEYTIFMCVLALVFVGAIAYIGNQYRETLVARQDTPQIDQRFVGSIRADEKTKDRSRTYRLYTLPAELQRN